jgi:hypothetical protein
LGFLTGPPHLQRIVRSLRLRESFGKSAVLYLNYILDDGARNSERKHALRRLEAADMNTCTTVSPSLLMPAPLAYLDLFASLSLSLCLSLSVSVSLCAPRSVSLSSTDDALIARRKEEYKQQILFENSKELTFQPTLFTRKSRRRPSSVN